MMLGYCSLLTWLSASLPQLAENRRLQSTEGLSFSFVLLGLLAMSCDTISAYSLNWALPNKLGAPISVLLQAALLVQFGVYRRQSLSKLLPLRSTTAGNPAAEYRASRSGMNRGTDNTLRRSKESA